MDQITDRLPGIIAIHNDICVYGKDTAEHDRNLLQLMQTAIQQGLVFNSSKCTIHQFQILFCGAISTVQGMRPDPSKVQALQDRPAPENSQKLQSFLALINTLQPFLPGLASKTLPKRARDKLGLKPLQSSSFYCLKSWLCILLLRTTLAYYDCTQALVLQTDTCKYCLSAALLQNNKPLAFTSKMLTNIETRYAYIERVPLCLFWPWKISYICLWRWFRRSQYIQHCQNYNACY